MLNNTQAAGTDCGRDFFDAGVYPGGDQLRIENNPAGHALLTEWLEQSAITLVGVEASGGYERSVCDCCLGKGLARAPAAAQVALKRAVDALAQEIATFYQSAESHSFGRLALYHAQAPTIRRGFF